MINPFERFVAIRYFRAARGREEGRRFLRFIMYIAVAGVAVGVSALLLALSIVRGFSQEIEDKIVGFGAHVQVENMQRAPLTEAPRLEAELRALPEVAGVAPVVQELALLRRSATEIEGVAIWGTEAPPAYLAEQVVAGAFEFTADERNRPGLVVGAQLAEVLGLAVGDPVTVFSMRRIGGLAGEGASSLQRPRVKAFRITGIYETSLSDFDELYAFTDLETARALLDYAPDEVTRLDVTLKNVEQAQAVAAQIEDTLGFPVMARSIYDVFRGLFAWVNLQESIIPLVIGVIVLVAAFNLIGTLLMMMLEKTREIGILQSMGASPRMLRRLFLWLGLLIGGVGTAIGAALALGLALAQQRYEIIPLPAEAYYMTSAPVALHYLDFVLVAGVALVLCLLAAYVPARAASRIEPIRAIRFR